MSDNAPTSEDIEARAKQLFEEWFGTSAPWRLIDEGERTYWRLLAAKELEGTQ